MEDIIEVDDQLIANKLAEPEWPWIIALAYSAEARTPNAIATVIRWRNYYDEGATRKVATDLTLTHLYRLVAGETPEFDWSVIEEIERPLIQAIRAGDIQSFGSEEPRSKPQLIDKTVWARGEIAMAEWSDLKPIGERKADNPTPACQNPTWYYDIHVSASDVRELVDVPPRPQIHQHAENWTKRALKNQQIAALDFFEISGARWRNGEVGNEDAFIAKYEKWIEKENRGTPLKRSAFRIWRHRGVQGYRVDGHKLILPE